LKEDKNALYNNKILQYLMDGETYTIIKLADNVGLSEKTVRTRMKQLDEWLAAEGFGKIEKKAGNRDMAKPRQQTKTYSGKPPGKRS